MSGKDARDLEDHLGRCEACRRDLEGRKRWLDACRSLPPLELPAGFARRVMEAAYPPPRRKRRLLPALAAGLASLSVIVVVLVATGVCSLPGLMTGSGRLLWRGLQISASWGAKVVAVFVALCKVLAQILRLAWEVIETLTAAAPPHAHILALVSLAVLAGFFLFGYRKYFVRR